MQTLRTLAGSLRTVSSRLDGHDAADAIEYAEQSERIAGETAEAMHTLLMRDGVLAGYGLFRDDGSIEHLVHPSDQRTGLRYGLLQIIHAISGNLLSPSEARAHLDVIDEHLLGPDVTDRVPNARPRQSTCYYSSSDATDHRATRERPWLRTDLPLEQRVEALLATNATRAFVSPPSTRRSG